MDILNSGSFVTLDNREKIEQLIYTARELAIEVSRPEGFQNSGQTNHQLGLEIWNGAEYMCRAHEEATIRNLFLSKFLERLREIEKQAALQQRPVPTSTVGSTTTQSTDPVPPQVRTGLASSDITGTVPAAASPEIPPPQESRDEYLGVISEKPSESNRPSYATECVPEWEAEALETSNGSETAEFVATAVGESKEDEAQDSIPPAIPEAEEDVTSESTTPEPGAGVVSITLSEKEPYNFDSCTVTAVIQLLPENDGTRKCVFSVRSHDFAPQITISDLPNDEVNESLKQCLETAIGQYRINLPVLAAEKLKTQKPASKKRSAKTVDKCTKTGSVSNIATSEASTVPPAAQNSEAGQDQRNLFAA